MRTIIIIQIAVIAFLFSVNVAKTQGLHSTAFGFHTTAPSYSSFAIGHYNRNPITYSATSWILSDPLFVIGNGVDALKTSNALTVLKNGNVGIGTSTPTERMDIIGLLKLSKALGGSNENNSPGLIFVSDDDFLFGGKHLNHYGLGAFTNGSSTQLKLYMSAFYGINFFTWGKSRMTISENGNVGIGTDLINNPNNYKLAVNGTIGAKEIKVETSSTTWPDFVFSDDYMLMPLKEVEAYISANKHLPQIPDANEIGKSGLDLGELIKLQMQKIEELTLYIIEQNKRIEKLEKQ